MELTVQDIVTQSGTVYEEGLNLAPNFYKKAITSDHYTDIVKAQDLQKGYICETLFEVASKVAVVALVIIPSYSCIHFYGLQTLVLGWAFLAGSLIALAREQTAYFTEEENKNDQSKVVKQRANLYACLSEENKNRYIAIRSWQIAYASLIYGGLSLTGIFQNTIVGVFALGYFGTMMGEHMTYFAIAGLKSRVTNIQSQVY